MWQSICQNGQSPIMTSYEYSHKSAYGHTLLTNGRKFMTNGVFLPMKQNKNGPGFLSEAVSNHIKQ